MDLVIDDVEKPVTAPSDAERLAAAAAGDAAGLDWLVGEIAPVVLGFLHPRVGGDASVAEDLLQETVLEALRSAPGFRGDAAASTWMCTIARRRVARHWERERRQQSARERLEAVATPAPPLEPDRYADRDEVVRALGALSALHRQVLVAKYLDGATVEEIAADLGRSRVQVQSLLQRARDAFRRSLGGAR